MVQLSRYLVDNLLDINFQIRSTQRVMGASQALWPYVFYHSPHTLHWRQSAAKFWHQYNLQSQSLAVCLKHRTLVDLMLVQKNNCFTGQNGQTISHVLHKFAAALKISFLLDLVDKSELASLRWLHHKWANHAHYGFVWTSRCLKRKINAHRVSPRTTAWILPVTYTRLVKKADIPCMLEDVEISTEFLLFSLDRISLPIFRGRMKINCLKLDLVALINAPQSGCRNRYSFLTP